MAAMVAVLVLLSGFTSLLTTSAQSETPPDKPSGLSTEAGDTQVRLSWEDPGDSTIDKYELWQIAESATLDGINNEFGYSVAVAGDIAVVGIPDDDESGPDSGAALVFSRVDGVWTQKYRLRTGDDAGVVKDDGFGSSITFDGNTIVVGAPFDDSKKGAAYLFVEPDDRWDNQNGTDPVDLTNPANLTAPNAAVEDEFGDSVAVDGNTVVVGAYLDDSTGTDGNTVVNSGSAYVFTKPGNAWVSTSTAATLTASGAAAGDEFGSSVAVDGNTIVVGASGDDGQSETLDFMGSAFVFVKLSSAGWVSTSTAAKLIACTRGTQDYFGRSGAIDGDTIVIGADGQDTNTGSAFVFAEPSGGWVNNTETAKLTASVRSGGDRFGFSVALDGDTVVVGAYGEASSKGSAYAFTKPGTSWANGTETTQLTASDRDGNARFGSSAAIDGYTVVVGAQNNDTAYVFDIVDWEDIAGSGAATTSHIVTGLTNDIDHTFRLRAVDGAEATDPSDSVAGTPKAASYPPVKLLNFSAVQTGDGEVEMTWDAHRYPLTVTGYEYNQDGGDWNAITGSDSSTHSHTVTGLTKDTTYTFAVRAVNGAGSTESDSRSVTIIGKPAAPDSFTAVAGDEQVWLGWRSPADFTISGYEYRQKEGTGAFGVWQKIPGSRSGTTFHIVTGLSNDTSYTFQVRAANAAGESETSGEQSATPATASSDPVKPEGFAARQTGIGHVELTRKASSNPLNVTGYEFRQDNGSWTTISGSDSRTVSHSVTGLTQGVTYACWVCAVNNFGESDPSNLWFVTIVATPQRPTGLSATAGDTQVTVDWDGPANIIPNQPINKYQLVQVPQSKLTASVPGTNDEFGYSVAIDGDTAVVGAHQHDVTPSGGGTAVANAGAAYVFTKDSEGARSQAATLTASDGAADDEFGISVAVYGETVVVGAHQHDATIGGNTVGNSGAAYVFTKPADGWADSTGTATLTASDGAENDYFGISLSLDGSTVVVGAPGSDSNMGAAYVFTWDSANSAWEQKAKLTASDGAANDEFGISVAVDGNTVVVGAKGHESNKGAAYVFTKPADGWADSTGTATLTASDGAENDYFGISLSLDGSTVVVGAPGSDSNMGAAYVFTWDSANSAWEQKAKLTASDGAANDEFGISVAVDGNSVVVGAYLDSRADDIVISSGSVYVFINRSGVWSETLNLAAPDAAPYDRFGYSVALDGGTLLAGVPQPVYFVGGTPIRRPGAAYLLEIANEDKMVVAEWVDLKPTDLTVSYVGSNLRPIYVYRVLGLDNDQEYAFRVRAVNDAGNSPSAETVAATPRLSKPGKPTGLSARAGNRRVTLSWDDPLDSSIDGYQVLKPPEQTKLTVGSDGGEKGKFGKSVAVDSGTAVVGAPEHDGTDTEGNPITDSGAAYVFTKDSSGWGQPIKLTAGSDGARNDLFGYSVAVDGDTIVVGAYQLEYQGVNNTVEKPGAAYIFTKVDGVWSQAAKLTASDGAVKDRFGYSVAVGGDTVVVGARGHNGKTGAAYVFTKVGGVWGNSLDGSETHRTETAKLTATGGATFDYFGHSVAVNRDTIVVGARGLDSSPSAAYVFTEVGGVWGQKAKLTASNADDDDQFGQSVAVDGDTVVVGAQQGDRKRGSAYVFTKPTGDNWANNTETARLAASDRGASDYLGASVAIRGSTIVVGAYAADIDREDDGALSGAAYVFTKPANVDWANDPNKDYRTESGKLTLPTDEEEKSDEFGNSVALDGQSMVVGAPEGNDGFGSVYVSDIPKWAFLASGAETTSATVRGLTNGAQYAFQVRAVEYESEGLPSDIVRATPKVSNVDEAGTVSVSLEQPEVGTALVVSLSDPDGSLSDISWQWARSSDGSDWSDIFGANSDSYTPVADDVGIYLQATASYTDGHGPGKSAHAVMERQTAQRGPSFEGDVTFTVEENTSPGTPVGDAITATDRDGDVLTYSVSGIDASSFVLDGSTGQITVGSGTLLDYESGPTRYTVVVSVHDGRGVYGDDDSTIDDLIEVSIDVSNVDEAGTVSVSLEQPEVGTALVVSLSDPDGSLSDISWQWARSSDGSDWSDIFGANSDSYTPVADDVGIYLQATASYTDGHGPGKSAHAVMERQTAQRGPSFEGDVTFTVEENTSPGTPVGDAITATDRDGDVLTYSLSGIDASSFVLDGSTGQITVGSGTLLDYESGPTRYTVVVSVHDGRGVYGDDDSTIDDLIEVSIDVSNVDEAGTVSVSLEQPEVGTALVVSLSDPDGSLSGISWQWARSSDRTDWQDMAGASSFTYTPVDRDGDKYLRVTASYADGEGSGKQAQAVLNNPVQGLPEPVATPTTTATDTPAPAPTPTPTPTAEPAPSEADGGEEGFPWWVIVAVVIGVVAGVVIIIVVLRSRR